MKEYMFTATQLSKVRGCVTAENIEEAQQFLDIKRGKINGI